MFFAFLPLPHCSSFVCLGRLFQSSVSRPAGQAVPLYAMAQAATHPTAAVFGSPANSLGSPLSWLLTASQTPTQKSITTPKPQRKRHASFRLLRHLPGHGLGHTRSRLARTASANHSVRASLHFFAATIPTLAQGCFTTHSSILSAGCTQRRKERKKRENPHLQ